MIEEPSRKLVSHKVKTAKEVAALIGAPPRTEAGKEFGLLAGRLDLAGLVIAYLWGIDQTLTMSLAAQALVSCRTREHILHRGALSRQGGRVAATGFPRTRSHEQ